MSNDCRRLHLCAPESTRIAQRIAAVLDTVDEAIAKTEAVIAKLKQVRAGLLHDLLTRGLDEHGQLRDPIAHPEQFKDSPLGRIPREWEAKTFKRIGLIAFVVGLLAAVAYSMVAGRCATSSPQAISKVFEISETIDMLRRGSRTDCEGDACRNRPLLSFAE